MEKIYEEEQQQQNQQQYNKRRRQMTFSIVLSFAVALFAIGSLIAVGFNQISYAAQGDPLQLNLSEDFLNAATTENDQAVRIPFLDDGNHNTIFCVEQDKEADDGGNYTSDGVGESLSDLVLSYILAYYNANQVLPDDFDTTVFYAGGEQSDEPGVGSEDNQISVADAEAYLKRYITQAAVWLYLDEIGRYNISSSTKSILTQPNVIRYGNISTNTSAIIVDKLKSDDSHSINNIYTSYILPLINKAKNAAAIKTVKATPASLNITKIDDGKIYRTDKIYVTSQDSESLLGYYVDLEGLPGAYAVDKDGNQIAGVGDNNSDYMDYTVSGNDYFYIYVPVNKVTEANHTVTIKVTGVFDTMALGEYYVVSGDSSAQKVVSVTHQNLRVDNETQINFLVSPDTGMTTAQTIYFIGLIVLLCGIGIIYANAKPIEE